MRPDIVLLDLGLPGMSGLTVIEALRGWTDVPIIVLTARDEERSKVLALDAGADDYVTKPFGMAELVARVRAALQARTRAPRPTSPSCTPPRSMSTCPPTVRSCTATERHRAPRSG